MNNILNSKLHTISHQLQTLFFCTLLVGALSLDAQTISLGSSVDEYMQNAIPSADGGFLLCGYSIDGKRRGIVTRLNAEQEIVWVKQFDNSDNVEVWNVHEFPNGDIILGININRSNDKRDFAIVKTNASGDIIWSKSYSNSSYDTPLVELDVMANGRIVITGYITTATVSNNNSSRDFMVSMLDADGNLLWSRVGGESGSGNNDWLNRGVELGDGNLLLLGSASASSYPGSYYNAYVMKVDGTTGDPIWHKGYPDSRNTKCYFAEELPNGDLALAFGSSDSWSSISDGYQGILMVDADGNQIFSKYYDLGDGENLGGVVLYNEGEDQLYFAGANHLEAESERANFYLKLNTDGSVSGAYEFDIVAGFGRGGVFLHGGNVYLASSSSSLPADGGTSSLDFMLNAAPQNDPFANCKIISLDANALDFNHGTPYSMDFSMESSPALTVADESFTVSPLTWSKASACTTPVRDLSLSPDVKIFPNPTEGVFSLRSNIDMKDICLEIRHLDGREVFKMHCDLSAGEASQVDMSTFPSALYVVMLFDGQGYPIYSTQLIKN